MRNWIDRYEPLPTAKTDLSRQSRCRAARALSPGRRRRSSRSYDLTEEERAAILNVDVRALYTMGVHSLLAAAVYPAQQSLQRRLRQSAERIGVSHADRICLRRQPCARNDRVDRSRAEGTSGEISRQLSQARRTARGIEARCHRRPHRRALGQLLFSIACRPFASAVPNTMTARSKNGCESPRRGCPAMRSWRRN